MAFAPHTNNQVAYELRAGHVPTPNPLILGLIRTRNPSACFEYAERRWPSDDFAPEFPHIIYVADALNPGGVSTRLAKVLKTVAYVVTDEDAEGNPIAEKWDLARHDQYATDWVAQEGRG